MSASNKNHVVQSSLAGYLGATGGAVILVALIAAPLWAGRADMHFLSQVFLYLSLASLWNLLAGYAGLISVGQHAFVGFGGYGLFTLAMFAGVHPYAAVPLVAIGGAIVAMPVAFLIFRLRGAYFAIGTWVIAEVFRLGFAQVSALGGGSGTSLPIKIVKSIAATRSSREISSYWMALAMVMLVLGVIYLLLRSRHGLALKAIRDNELASESLGIDILKSKLTVYIITAGLTAGTGSLIFLQKLRISPDAAFSVNDWTAFVIFIVVIGGIGTLEGPIIGTIVFFLLRETLADLGTTYLLILGFVAIVVMLRAPKGLWGYLKAKFGLELFPLSRQVIPKKRPGTGSDPV